MKAFVTGGTGFIGSHLVDRLVKEGYDVVCLVRRNLQEFQKLGMEAVTPSYLRRIGVEIVYGDLRDKDSLIRIARKIKDIDIVFHLGALARAYEYLGVKDYFLTNVEGTRNLLEAFKNYGLKRFIYTSSIEAVGGSKTGEPLTEDARCNPFGIYGKTKRLAELITLEYFQEYNMPNCILRFVMTYGPRSTLLWPRLFNLVRKGFYPVIGDGNTKWEFCYVGNEVEGMIKAAETKKI